MTQWFCWCVSCALRYVYLVREDTEGHFLMAINNRITAARRGIIEGRAAGLLGTDAVGAAGAAESEGQGLGGIFTGSVGGGGGLGGGGLGGGGSGAGSGVESATAALVDESLAAMAQSVRFMTNLCLGHNAAFQNLLREQPM